MTELIPGSFDAITIGEHLGPIRVVVDRPFAKRFAFAVDDDSVLRFMQESNQVVPAAVLADLLRLMNLKFDPNDEAGLHQREEVWFYGAIPVDETIELSGLIAEKFVKRGRGSYVVEATARSVEDGRIFVKHRATDSTEIAIADTASRTERPASGIRRVEGIVPKNAPYVTHVAENLAAGAVVEGPVKRLLQDQMSVFSNVGEFWRTIHTDRLTAQRAGLRDTVAQGLMTACYASEMAGAFFGRPWFTSGWLNLAFVAPVYAGDIVSLTGLLVGAQELPSATDFELEVWAENQNGSRVAVGWLGAAVERQ